MAVRYFGTASGNTSGKSHDGLVHFCKNLERILVSNSIYRVLRVLMLSRKEPILIIMNNLYYGSKLEIKKKKSAIPYNNFNNI